MTENKINCPHCGIDITGWKIDVYRNHLEEHFPDIHGWWKLISDDSDEYTFDTLLVPSHPNYVEPTIEKDSRIYCGPVKHSMETVNK